MEKQGELASIFIINSSTKTKQELYGGFFLVLWKLQRTSEKLLLVDIVHPVLLVGGSDQYISLSKRI